MKLIKFSAKWCGPCRQLQQVMEGKNFGVDVENVDVDLSPDLASEYHVRGVPTLILVNDDNKEIARKMGVVSEAALRSWIVEFVPQKELLNESN